ncbi:hypothetical protein R1flu_002593 [Riccia fluitans]|uniref:Uncharacterized protein n=1 Tax=Riccia fluitans TaxID=41844 RepID=A0ABD1Y6J3_9MARC
MCGKTSDLNQSIKGGTVDRQTGARSSTFDATIRYWKKEKSGWNFIEKEALAISQLDQRWSNSTGRSDLSTNSVVGLLSPTEVMRLFIVT